MIPRRPGKLGTSAAKRASAAAFPSNVSAAAHVGEALNPERVAFADQKRDAAILAEEARRRLDHAELAQLPQRLRVAHENIGVEAGPTTDVEREVAERNCSRADHLYTHGLRQGHHHDIV